MVKGVLTHGSIRPTEALPTEWHDGQQLRIEKVDSDTVTSEQIDEDFAALNALCAAGDPADDEVLERALAEADRQAKEIVRRQMGLE